VLGEMEYSMQFQKSRAGPQPRHRDQPFRDLNRPLACFRKSGDPVPSVDTKKKELAFQNGGGRGDPRETR
jgi:hypothetical protein